jgi:hypothetical protein
MKCVQLKRNILAPLGILLILSNFSAQAANGWKEAEISGGAEDVGTGLEITLRKQGSQLEFVRIRQVRQQFRTLPETDHPTHFIKILRNDSKEPIWVPFEHPSIIYGAPPITEEEATNPSQKHIVSRDNSPYSINLKLAPGSHTVQLFDSANRLLDERSIPQIRQKPRKVKPKKIRGDEFLDTDGDSVSLTREQPNSLANLLTGLMISNAQAARPEQPILGTASVEGVVRIAFISDNYATDDETEFEGDVNNFVAFLLKLEPLKTRADELEFYKIFNLTSLDCAYDPVIDRLLTCDNSLVVEAANDTEFAYDMIAVIVNNPTYGGSGGQIPVANNGPLGPATFAHEFGHGFARLTDEYVVCSSNTNCPYDGGSDTNCYFGAPPAPAWEAVVNPIQYVQNCKITDWYRSSETSIMRSVAGNPVFNPISQYFIGRKLDTYRADEGEIGDDPPRPPIGLSTGAF